MLIQILISLVATLAIISVTRRFLKGAISKKGLIVAIIFWGGAVMLVWNPNLTSRIAAILGVTRGVDALIYLSVVILFYALFRLYGKIENLEHQLSEIAKKFALKDFEK